MTSFALHISVTIFLASFAVRVGPIPEAMLVLNAFARVHEDRLQATTIVNVPKVTAPRRALENEMALAIAPITERAPQQQPLTTSDPETTQTEAEIDPPVEEPTEKVVEEQPDSPLPPDIPLAPGELVMAAARLSGNAKPVDLTPQPRLAPTIHPARHDEVVARFIQYDVGLLEGREGQQARREFDLLGTDAIPALVRGLNQSARIRASCPVGVITSRLRRNLRESKDPAMLQYALDNIGKNVPPQAPYARQIRSFRDNLETELLELQFQRDLAGITHFRGEPRRKWQARVKRLYSATSKNLNRALDSNTPGERTAAWTALAIRERTDLPEGERIMLADKLLAQWSYHTPPYRMRIHEALDSLARSCRPRQPRPGWNPQDNDTREAWQKWWGLTRRAGESLVSIDHSMLTPPEKLRLAVEMEHAGRWRDAVEIYEGIVNDNPKTREALPAQKRLSEMGFGRFEMRGN